MNKKAFTLLEVIIVVVIIGLLASLIIPTVQRVRFNTIVNAYNKGVKVDPERLKWAREYSKGSELKESLWKRPNSTTDVHVESVPDETPRGFNLQKVVIDGKTYYIVPRDANFEEIRIKGKNFMMIPAQ